MSPRKPRRTQRRGVPLPVPAFCLGQPLMLGYATPLVRFAAATANR